jgi:TP901 family phage tail tape measure protein
MLGLDIGSVVAHLMMDTKQFDTAIRSAQQRTQQFAQAMGRMGSYLTLRLTLPLVYLGVKATKSFAAFDDAITRSAAVTRGMTREMRKEMEETALTLSRVSILSATELAEGYFALGQAGYSAAQSIKVLPAVQEFAIASSLDLDTSIRYLSRTMEGLAMSSEDPVKMMEAMVQVSDAFTFAAITTTAEIQDFAVAMTHAAAPALRLVNKGVEEGISVLMAFARAGIVAEESGTLLWTTVRDLQRANVRFRSQWERLGLTVYDVNKNMLNLADIFEQLEDRFAGMSDEGKKVSLMMLGFQDRSLRGIQALMGFSAEMKIWQEQMRKGRDLTKQVAETYLKSFNAQLLMIRNNLEVLKIRIGWMLSPLLEKFREKLHQFVTWWERLSDATKLIIVEVGVLLMVLGPLLIAFSKLVFMLSWAGTGFIALGTAVWNTVVALTALSATAVVVLGIFALLVAVAYAWRAAYIQGVDAVVEKMDFFVEMSTLQIRALAQIFGGFVHFLRTLVWAELVEFLKDVGAALLILSPAYIATQMAKGTFSIAEMFVDAREKIGVALDGIKKEVKDLYFDIEPYLIGLKQATKEHLEELADALKKQWGEDMDAVITLIKEKVAKMNEELLKYLPAKDLREIAIVLEKAKQALKDLSGGEYSLKVFGHHLIEVKKLAERFEEVAVRAFESTTDAIVEFATTGKASIKELANVILTDLLTAIVRAQLATVLTASWMPGGPGDPGRAGNWPALLAGLPGRLFGGGGPSEFALASRDMGEAWLKPFARGAAFDLGQIIPMQMGHIIGGPALFPMSNRRTALIAEAGPEAVMPLTRTRTGELGVRSEQTPINVDNRTKIVNVMDQNEILSAVQSSKGERVIMNVLRRKGII